MSISPINAVESHPMNSLTMMVYSALFAALIAAGAFIAIPIGPVPIVLQNFFVFLAGLVLGPRWGLASVAVYLLAGALGLPVFAGATGGIGRFAGPTGGYLFSYLPTVWLIGYLSERYQHRPAAEFIALAAGGLLVFAIGVPWLKFVTGMDWLRAFSVGMLPFLPGLAVKIIAAVPAARAVRPVLSNQMPAQAVANKT